MRLYDVYPRTVQHTDLDYLGILEPHWLKYQAFIKLFLLSRNIDSLSKHYQSVYKSKDTLYYTLRSVGNVIYFTASTDDTQWPREAVLEMLSRAIQQKRGAPQTIWYDRL